MKTFMTWCFHPLYTVTKQTHTHINKAQNYNAFAQKVFLQEGNCLANNREWMMGYVQYTLKLRGCIKTDYFVHKNYCI